MEDPVNGQYYSVADILVSQKKERARKKPGKVEFLTGKDYPHLCEGCQDAISTAAIYLREGGPDVDDPEAPCDYAYDHGWLCSSRGYDGCKEDN